jgi:hypothetical protein
MMESDVMRSSLALVCLLSLTACDESVTGPSVALNETFELQPGSSAVISGASFAVRFNRVTGDSRCPADAVCIQGGDAIVSITALDGDALVDLELHTGSMAPVPYGRYTITLVQLQPYPFSSRTIQPGEYRATLKVTR